MTTPDLEDRLPDALLQLAGGVDAPPTLEVDRAVRGRTVALRRRRRSRRVMGVATLAAASVVAGVVWLPGGDPGRPDVSTDPADADPDARVPVGQPGTVPALVVEHPEATVISAFDETVSASGLPEPVTEGAEVARQLFRRPGDYAGPLVVVSSGSLEVVQVRHDGLDHGLDPDQGRTGGLDPRTDAVEFDDGAVRSRITPVGDGQAVRVDAIGLSAEDHRALADGLERRDGGAGWEATVRPAGLEELRFDPQEERTAPIVERMVGLTFGPGTDRVHITAESVLRSDARSMEAVFLYGLWNRRERGVEVRPVEVLGRPALLIDPAGDEPEVLWRHTTTAAVDLHLPAADPATLDDLIAGIRELTPEEWAALKTTVPHQP